MAIKQEPSMDLQKKMAGDAYRVMFTFIPNISPFLIFVNRKIQIMTNKKCI